VGTSAGNVWSERKTDGGGLAFLHHTSNCWVALTAPSGSMSSIVVGTGDLAGAR